MNFTSISLENQKKSYRLLFKQAYLSFHYTAITYRVSHTYASRNKTRLKLVHNCSLQGLEACQMMLTIKNEVTDTADFCL